MLKLNYFNDEIYNDLVNLYDMLPNFFLEYLTSHRMLKELEIKPIFKDTIPYILLLLSLSVKALFLLALLSHNSFCLTSFKLAKPPIEAVN